MSQERNNNAERIINAEAEQQGNNAEHEANAGAAEPERDEELTAGAHPVVHGYIAAPVMAEPNNNEGLPAEPSGMPVTGVQQPIPIMDLVRPVGAFEPDSMVDMFHDMMRTLGATMHFNNMPGHAYPSIPRISDHFLDFERGEPFGSVTDFYYNVQDRTFERMDCLNFPSNIAQCQRRRDRGVDPTPEMRGTIVFPTRTSTVPFLVEDLPFAALVGKVCTACRNRTESIEDMIEEFTEYDPIKITTACCGENYLCNRRCALEWTSGSTHCISCYNMLEGIQSDRALEMMAERDRDAARNVASSSVPPPRPSFVRIRDRDEEGGGDEDDDENHGGEHDDEENHDDDENDDDENEDGNDDEDESGDSGREEREMQLAIERSMLES